MKQYVLEAPKQNQIVSRTRGPAAIDQNIFMINNSRTALPLKL